MVVDSDSDSDLDGYVNANGTKNIGGRGRAWGFIRGDRGNRFDTKSDGEWQGSSGHGDYNNNLDQSTSIKNTCFVTTSCSLGNIATVTEPVPKPSSLPTQVTEASAMVIN